MLSIALQLAAICAAAWALLYLLFHAWDRRGPVYRPPGSTLDALLVRALRVLARAGRFILAPVPATLAVMAAWASFLLAPGTAFADTGGAVASLLSGPIGALAISVIIAPLLGVIAHKYLPAGEKAVDDGIDASPFFKRHQQIAGFAKLFVHDLDLQLIKLNDLVVADAKASGKFDAELASEVRKQAIAGALEFAGQSNRDALAQQLGFTVPSALDGYLNRLLEGRLAAMKADGTIPTVAPAGGAGVPAADPSKPRPAAA